MQSTFRITAILLGAAILSLSACGVPGAASAPVPASGSGAQSNLLSNIAARGTVVVSTDADYPPQSAIKSNPQRASGTKCAPDQMTLGELEGFDIDTAAAIASRLGVEACFVTPDWSLVTGGGWAGGWDISVGSMAITSERVKVLYFAQPYYTSPAVLFIHAANTSYSQPSELSGRRIGVLRGSTYQSYLDATLSLPGVPLDFPIRNAQVAEYDDDNLPLVALATGEGGQLDAVLTSQALGQQAIDAGQSLKQLGDPVFVEYLAPAIDRASPLDPRSFVANVSNIVASLHADGTLLALSQRWYKTDLTSAAARFDAAEFGK